MAASDFQLVGYIEIRRPAEFLVISTAIPSDPSGKAGVLMEDAIAPQQHSRYAGR